MNENTTSPDQIASAEEQTAGDLCVLLAHTAGEDHERVLRVIGYFLSPELAEEMREQFELPEGDS